MTITTSDLLNQAEALSMADILAALPQEVRVNPHVLKRLQAARGTEAASIYKNFFWEDNPNDRGNGDLCQMSSLLPLMKGCCKRSCHQLTPDKVALLLYRLTTLDP